MLPVELANGDFLTLSRRQPDYFSSPLAFRLPDATQVTVLAPGIIQFEPAIETSKDVILSSGVHGNETAPIEICEDFVKRLLTGELHAGQRLLFIFGNLPSMDIAQRFVDENMNRLFCGEHSQPPGLVNAERVRAKELEQAVASFYAGGRGSRIHYDLHTAIRPSKNEKFAVYPFLHGKPRKIEQLQMMLACGVNTILLSESPTTTFSYFSSRDFGADSFTVELGKVMPFGQNDMTRFEEVQQTLENLICGRELCLKAYQPEDFLIYRVNQVVNKQQSDFVLHFADDAPNFSDFAAGTLLASETGEEYHAEQDGEAIVFPNANVAIGQRALLTVVPTQITEEGCSN